MKTLRGIVLAISVGAAALAVHASDAEIKKALNASYPDISIASVKASPFPGVFEVLVGQEIVYTDGRGKFIIQGTMIDVATKKNLTEERLQQVNKVNFADLPLNHAVVKKYGTGERKVVVFADPNCGFCKKLERDYIPHLKNVTIYTLLTPILSPDSAVKSRGIWCASDRTKAWEDWIQREIAVPQAPEACDTKVIDSNLELARKLRVTGTPTLIFESGSRLAGALPVEEIEKQFVRQK